MHPPAPPLPTGLIFLLYLLYLKLSYPESRWQLTNMLLPTPTHTLSLSLSLSPSPSLSPVLPMPQLTQPDESLSILNLLSDHLLHYISCMDINSADSHDALSVSL